MYHLSHYTGEIGDTSTGFEWHYRSLPKNVTERSIRKQKIYYVKTCKGTMRERSTLGTKEKMIRYREEIQI